MTPSPHLRRGPAARVTFPLNNRSFATWAGTGARAGWKVLPGCYRLGAGRSSRALLLL